MSPDDTVMVDMFAEARALVHRTPKAAQLEISGKILCVIFDAVKEAYPEYPPQAHAFREQFRGLAASAELRAQFLESLTATVLMASTLQVVVAEPFSSLFRERLME